MVSLFNPSFGLPNSGVASLHFSWVRCFSLLRCRPCTDFSAVWRVFGLELWIWDDTSILLAQEVGGASHMVHPLTVLIDLLHRHRHFWRLTISCILREPLAALGVQGLGLWQQRDQRISRPGVFHGWQQRGCSEVVKVFHLAELA